MRIRTREVRFDATQWFGVGDCDGVTAYAGNEKPCPLCGETYNAHGWIQNDVPKGDCWLVCPGDWIILDVGGRMEARHPTEYHQEFEAVGDDEPKSMCKSVVPKVPGIYWYRMQGSGIWRHQDVVEFGGVLGVFNTDKPTPVAQMKREWYGPLPGHPK
ncbi:MAG: hypothetical protein IH951_11745 [Bacteroidetes bacterium]|nr:hypothetical protein [Bacteroidota bacterium]